jgi:hypothetical protein
VPTDILVFAANQAKAQCDQLQNCCVTADPAFKLARARCEKESLPGLDYALAGINAGGVNGRNLKLNAAKAQECLTKITALSCDIVGVPGVDRRAVVNACTAAVEGLAGAGAKCANDVECVAGTHCGPQGVCRAHLPAGSPCSNKPQSYHNECSTRGFGDTGLFCNDTCVSLLANGEKCVYGESCQSGACSVDSGGKCADVYKYSGACLDYKE